MRFSFAESMCDPSQYIPLAMAAEQNGWHSFVVPDSLCYPEHSDSRYPYTPDGDRHFLQGKPFVDPFTLIPALGPRGRPADRAAKGLGAARRA